MLELDMDSSRNPESREDRRVIAPQEACNQIAEVVHEALKKMEMVADEKMRMFKKAHRNRRLVNLSSMRRLGKLLN
ncbi:hypothetical protein LOK49_LG14G01700 [Camellia lanceoleosa]|uniref:Uncharacterized protein n=1 Tax=Camellia lanceoleosa TaxID=1840588 RepID=A0ACC0F9G7_9ERIC|nr:hypothetical protein LOK49_LG14G01700 [Camellia lanceoleosa]